MRYRLNPCHFLCNQDLWQLLKVHKITTMVNLTVTHNFPTIDCSWGVGWSAEFPEFPDQEAEGGVLLAGSQTGRADGKQQVSIFSLSFFHHIFSFPQLCFHLLSVSSWTQSVFYSYLFTCSVVYSVFLLDTLVIISQSIIYPGCLDRACQHTTYCFPVWPVFLLTWC